MKVGSSFTPVGLKVEQTGAGTGVRTGSELSDIRIRGIKNKSSCKTVFRVEATIPIGSALGTVIYRVHHRVRLQVQGIQYVQTRIYKV